MIPANDASGDLSTGSKSAFTDAFIRNAHIILFAGYARLDAPAYQASEEDEITGDLAREMNEVICTNPAPWMRMFQVHDQHPVTAPGGPATTRRVGKRRSKIDLQFVANTGSGIHRFSWEAKRLGPGHAIGAYLGPAGLGCFLTGQYSSECDFGGMIGYAQSKDEQYWLDSITKELGKMGISIRSHPVLKTKIGPHVSNHPRDVVGRLIAIHHSLLGFN
ncbi:MAG: hypothetical protein ABI600_14880 [Luteolibacter sp.]